MLFGILFGLAGALIFLFILLVALVLIKYLGIGWTFLILFLLFWSWIYFDTRTQNLLGPDLWS
jgi:hypothetical protein